MGFLKFHFSIAISLISLAASVAGANEDCPLAFQKIKVTADLQLSLSQLQEGRLEVIDSETGQRYLASGRVEVSGVLSDKYLQPTKVASMAITGRPVNGRGREVAVGRVRVEYGMETRHLTVSTTLTHPPFQASGISTLTIGAVVREFPDVKSVSGELVGTNQRAFLSALRKAQDSHSANAREQAFKATPFYKTMSRFGFTEIDFDHSSFDPLETSSIHQINLRLRKPKQQ